MANGVKQTRRPKGEGYKKVLPDGRVRGCITLKNAYGEPFKKTFTAQNEADFYDQRNRLIYENKNGQLNKPDRLTLNEFLESWLEKEVRTQNEFPTYRSYSGAVKNHIVPVIGSKRLTNLRTEDVKNLIYVMHERELGQRTQQLVFAVLRCALNHAVETKLINKNPCPRKGPKLKKKSLEIPTDEDVAKLLKAAARDPLNALYVLAIHTGMRQGELFALHWEDVNLKKSQITIRKSAQPGKGCIKIKAPKSSSGFRTIEIDPTTLKAMETHRMNLTPVQAKSNLVFPSSEGTVLRQSNFLRRNYYPLLVSAGIQRRNFHSLRHYHATALLDAGTPIKAVQERLGHESPETTIRIYGHLTRNGKAALMTNLKNHMRNVYSDLGVDHK